MRSISDIIRDNQVAHEASADVSDGEVELTETDDAQARLGGGEPQGTGLESLEPDNDDPPQEDTWTASVAPLPDPFERLLKYEVAQRATASPNGLFGRLRHDTSAKTSSDRFEAAKPDYDKASDLDQLTPLADLDLSASLDVRTSVESGGSKRTGRVKTRLLGFSAADFESSNPFEKPLSNAQTLPVGWLVVVSEQGRGASFTVGDGVCSIGRGQDQSVCLDFGDNSISRENHASIAFDAEQRKFFIGQSGKANLVRLNNVPLLSTEELKSNDTIRIGQTTLRFVALCGETFTWEDEMQKRDGRV